MKVTYTYYKNHNTNEVVMKQSFSEISFKCPEYFYNSNERTIPPPDLSEFVEITEMEFKTGHKETNTNNRFCIKKTILSDFALFAIVDNELNKVVCHLVYDNGEEYCEEMAKKMLYGLNRF